MKRNKTKSSWTRTIISCVLVILFLFSLKLKMVYAKENDRNCVISIPIAVELKADTQNVTPEVLKYKLESTDNEKITENVVCEISVSKTGITTGSFNKIRYVEPGDYHYKVYQQEGDNQNIAYDNSVYEVTVRVVNTETGSLTAEVWELKDETEQKVNEIKFINYYKTDTQATKKPRTDTTHHTVTNTITRSSVGTSSPKTGDMSNLFLWGVIAILSLLCIVIFIFAGKRRNIQS